MFSFTGMKYKILQEEIVYDGFLKVKKATVVHDSFKGSEQVSATRETVERGDSVAVLLYETETDSLLFTNQFRYPVTKNDGGWIIELPAGKIEEGEAPQSCAKREVLEELGYEAQQLEEICHCYLSPGGSTERIFLFYAEVTQAAKTEDGGGVETENEDIQLYRQSVHELSKTLDAGFFKDAKTLLALQWFMLRKLNDI